MNVRSAKPNPPDDQVREALEFYYRKYNTPDFIAPDPVSVPHRFTERGDIEISGFLTATISWGQRTTILKNAAMLMQLMDERPYEFVLNAGTGEIRSLGKFVHRTFNGTDAMAFVRALRRIYIQYDGPEAVFLSSLRSDPGRMDLAIHRFRSIFLSSMRSQRTSKHLADPLSGAAAKRINMFLRWMVRRDAAGVDFGIWNSIPPEILMCPLDLHSGRVARALGLLKRKQDDWRSVEELTAALRKFDPSDPVRYDFALFGLGVNEKTVI